MSSSRRAPAAIAVFGVAVVVIAVVAWPALAANQGAALPTSAAPAASASPDASGPPAKPDKAAKKVKVPTLPVTLNGVVRSRTNASGETEYTLSSGSQLLSLDAGPAWFYKDDHPLKPHVGKQVRIGGEQAQGSTEVEVLTLNGVAIRAAGRPPWAGGWKRVGEDHPGWTQEKWDRWQAKLAEKKARFGLDCWPPGHCKDASGKPTTPAATAAP